MIELKEFLKQIETQPVVPKETYKLASSDINKLAELLEKQSSRLPILSKFAEAITQLAVEYDEFTKMATKRILAEEIVEKMVKNGQLSNSEIFSKISELENKTEEDLKITSKAMDYNKVAQFNLGALSDHIENDGTDLHIFNNRSNQEALQLIIGSIR